VIEEPVDWRTSLETPAS